jgi:uncharacterized membrane protein
MFWEWLERTLYGIVAVLLFIVVIAVIILIGALWLLLYKAVAWFAILVLAIFTGIPIITLIYTIYDNWFLVTEFFKNLRNKLK